MKYMCQDTKGDDGIFVSLGLFSALRMRGENQDLLSFFKYIKLYILYFVFYSHSSKVFSIML